MKHYAGPRLTRPLPKLIALPMPDFKAAQFKAKPDTLGFKNRFANQKEIELKDVSIYKSAILSSVDELLAVIKLTLSFLKDGPSYVTELEAWLSEMEGCLYALEEGVWRGDFDDQFIVTMDTEGLMGFDDFLNGMPLLEEIDDELETPPDSLARTLITFWLNEIKRRAWELINICISSVDVGGAEQTFQVMKSFHYPV